MASWVVAAALSVASAEAVAPPSPWNGTNPFRCTIQDAGKGTTVPDPGADPYCVRFDKTGQNVTELGLVDFLTKEPARVEGATPKCFYFQEDHWRGSVIQSDQRTVVYEFVGHYFFNKATGDGGAWVTGFQLAGQTSDPRALPGFPPQYDQYYGPGTGGVISHNDVATDPGCVARAERNPGSIYATPSPHCLSGGTIGRTRIGPVALGMTIGHIRAQLGRPGSSRRGLFRYCVAAGGSLLIAAHRIRKHERATILISTSPGFTLRGRRSKRVAAGRPVRALRAAFPHARPTLRLAGTTVLRLVPSRRTGCATNTLIAGVARGRVIYLATFAESAIPTRGALTRYLKRIR
jgi:hypothetical protein